MPVESLYLWVAVFLKSGHTDPLPDRTAFRSKVDEPLPKLESRLMVVTRAVDVLTPLLEPGATLAPHGSLARSPTTSSGRPLGTNGSSRQPV